MIKKEYEDILEKLPEGILITNEENEVKFMNQELKLFLNVTDETYNQGLYLKMFKKYKISENKGNGNNQANVEFEEEEC